MSLTSGQPAERGQPGTQRAIDRAGDRATAAATMPGAHTWQTVGVGHDVQALYAGVVRVAGVADRRAAGDAGEFAVAQLNVGGRLIDSIGWVGVDGRRVGVFATVAPDMNGLYVTGEIGRAHV